MGSDLFFITETKLFIGKKFKNVDNKNRLRTFFCDIACNYLPDNFFEKVTK